MSREVGDSLRTTATGNGLRASDAFTLLRWVYPAWNLVTVLADMPVVLGRSLACTTRLDTESVSRRHAELTLVSGTLVVRDLDSKNGVFVNARMVREAPLRTGDVLRLGDCVAVVEKTNLDASPGFRDLGQGILGGATMAPVVERVRQAALRGSDVLFVGETGTGKELLARALHRFSARTGAFIVFDCAGGPETTRAMELFGRTSGPGVGLASIGHVRSAQNGTLLLDSIPDLPLEYQTKLVRVLERREVIPLGEERPIAVDVRFVAKSTATFEAEFPGRFEPDLRKHFEGSIIRVPPLRERRADIIPLFWDLLRRHGCDRSAELKPELVERLCLRDWPMNVRELDRTALRMMASGPHELELGPADLAEQRSPYGSSTTPTTAPPALPTRRLVPRYSEHELAALRAALERHQGNLTKAANELVITRSKAYRMLRTSRVEG
jgi:DNA-binding NtrC family response regulator